MDETERLLKELLTDPATTKVEFSLTPHGGKYVQLYVHTEAYDDPVSFVDGQLSAAIRRAHRELVHTPAESRR